MLTSALIIPGANGFEEGSTAIGSISDSSLNKAKKSDNLGEFFANSGDTEIDRPPLSRSFDCIVLLDGGKRSGTVTNSCGIPSSKPRTGKALFEPTGDLKFEGNYSASVDISTTVDVVSQNNAIAATGEVFQEEKWVVGTVKEQQELRHEIGASGALSEGVMLVAQELHKENEREGVGLHKGRECSNNEEARSGVGMQDGSVFISGADENGDGEGPVDEEERKDGSVEFRVRKGHRLMFYITTRAGKPGFQFFETTIRGSGHI